MRQEIHTQINNLSREDITSILEGRGYAVYDSESTDSLRETIREDVMNGEISECELEY